MRCKEKELNIYINWYVYIGIRETDVTYRIDKNEAVTSQWGMSTDRTATFYSGDIDEFLDKLSKAKTIYVLVTPYGKNPINARFNLGDMAWEVDNLKQACNDKNTT